MNKEKYLEEEKKLLQEGYNIFEVDAILNDDDPRYSALAVAYKTGDLSLYASISNMYRNAENLTELDKSMTETYEDSGELTR